MHGQQNIKKANCVHLDDLLFLVRLLSVQMVTLVAT